MTNMKSIALFDLGILNSKDSTGNKVPENPGKIKSYNTDLERFLL
jgi:hypothetical protein